MTGPQRRWRRVGAALIALVMLWLVLTFIATWRLTHRRYGVTEPPLAPVDMPAEQIRLTTSDGQKLGAWLVRGRSDRPAVILLHGMRGSRQNHAALMRKLHDDGCTVLAVTLRGHGDSTGEIIDFGYSSRHDVVAAVDRLALEKTNGRIIVCGTSMGGAAALFAGKDLDSRVSGYLLESPYKDLKTAAWNRVSVRLPPVIDTVTYLGLRMWAQVLLPVHPNVISPYEAIKNIPASVPVVILSGGLDRHATTQEAQAMCEVVRTHGRVITFARGRHARLFQADPELYYDALRSLLIPR